MEWLCTLHKNRIWPKHKTPGRTPPPPSSSSKQDAPRPVPHPRQRYRRSKSSLPGRDSCGGLRTRELGRSQYPFPPFLRFFCRDPHSQAPLKFPTRGYNKRKIRDTIFLTASCKEVTEREFYPPNTHRRSRCGRARVGHTCCPRPSRRSCRIQ